MGRQSTLTAAAAAFVLAVIGAQPASAQVDEARARELLTTGRAAVAEGRLEDAYAALREAAALTANTAALLELAEIADRLRIDDVALQAYEIWLASNPGHESHVAITGRARVLREIVRGGRYVPSPDGRQVRLLVDWDGRPLITQQIAPGGPRPLIDWHGRPVQLPAAQPPRLIRVRFDDQNPSLGRQLDTP